MYFGEIPHVSFRTQCRVGCKTFPRRKLSDYTSLVDRFRLKWEGLGMTVMMMKDKTRFASFEDVSPLTCIVYVSIPYSSTFVVLTDIGIYK